MKPLFLGHGADNRQVRLSTDERLAHMHVIGSSGSGKSKFLEHILRQDIQNGQGFALLDPHGTLCEDVLKFASHKVARREVIILNPSRPDFVIGFNPFRRAPDGDISVQVDRRVNAIMRAWGVENTDQTPTLARTLRLLFAVMIEHGLGLKQARHLIDFNAHTIRDALIEEFCSSPFIKSEWQELQLLKHRDWREETLSARNRLFKFLTSETLSRFMGLPDRSIDLLDIMEQGKIVLVNLTTSDYLSSDNARTFGALLVNEFYECAKRRSRDRFGRPPKPYYLYMDEFQNFISLDIDDMLDQTRKFGLFLVLAHQRFGQLDENITDAVLTNCRIKAVFGGLPVESAKLMAGELFINKLDPMKIKAAIYQTKFWPEYRREKVYTRGTSSGHSSGSSQSSNSGSFTGSMSGQAYFQPSDWFLSANGTTVSDSYSSGSSSTSSSGYSESDSYSESESVADIPIFFPVPFQELSSVQYYTVEEQLTEMTAALKEQFPRHCFIKIHGGDTQPLLVPMVKDPYTTQRNLNWYRSKKLEESRAISAAEADRLIDQQETALLQKAASPPFAPFALETPVIEAEVLPPSEDERENPSRAKHGKGSSKPIWNRASPKTP